MVKLPSAPVRAARRFAATTLGVISAAVFLAACGPSSARDSAVPTATTRARTTTTIVGTKTTQAKTTQAKTTTTRARTTTTTTRAKTTPAVPPNPQPTAEEAANLFMQSWIDGNRAGSASVAVGSAVATLYATHYANQPLNDRGCTSAFPPLICTWGPYAGGKGSIYQVSVKPVGASWYVSAVMIES